MQLMKGSLFVQFLVLKKKNVFIMIFLLYMGMIVNGAWSFEQILYIEALCNKAASVMIWTPPLAGFEPVTLWS